MKIQTVQTTVNRADYVVPGSHASETEKISGRISLRKLIADGSGTTPS